MKDKTSNSAPALILEGVSLQYQQKYIFRNLNTRFPAAQFSVLLGSSGVGKSSLLRMIAGLQNYNAGSIHATDGQSLSNRISYMGQQDFLLPWAKVIQNVMIGSHLRGEKRDRSLAEHLLEQVGLSDQCNAYPQSLSGGMRQRVALARVLYENRPIILMDEPFSALDTVTRTRMQDFTVALLRGKTVLLITHDPFEACRMGEHIQVLAGQPAELYGPIAIKGTIPRHADTIETQQAQSELLALLLRKAEQ